MSDEQLKSDFLQKADDFYENVDISDGNNRSIIVIAVEGLTARVMIKGTGRLIAKGLVAAMENESFFTLLEISLEKHLENTGARFN